jgi:hypothetical protein
LNITELPPSGQYRKDGLHHGCKVGKASFHWKLF